MPPARWRRHKDWRLCRPAGDARAQIGITGERCGRHFGIGRIDVGVVALRRPRLRVERQAIAHRRIAGNEVAALGAQEPRAGLPPVADVLHDRQHVADRVRQPLREDLGQARPLERVVDARIERVDVDRQPALAPQVVIDVLEGREDVFGRDAQALGDALEETPGMLGGGAVIDALVGVERRRIPDRLAVLAPEAVQRPARQLLAGIPLALAEVHQPVRGILVAQAVEEVGGELALGRAERGGVPFGAVRVVDRRRRSARRPCVRRTSPGEQLAVDLVAERLRSPAIVRRV